MPDNRREFLQRMLAVVPASIIGRGFLKSKNVPNAVYASDTPIVFADNLRPSDLSRFPDGWHLYESCGQSMFQVYGASGGLCTQSMAYLVRKKPVMRNSGRLYMYDVDGGDLGRGSGTYWEYEWECIPLEFSDLQFIAVDFDEAAVKRLINLKIEYAIKYRKPTVVNLDGGNFPRVTERERALEAVYFNGLRFRGQQYVDHNLHPIDYPDNLKLAEHLTGVIPTLYGKK